MPYTLAITALTTGAGIYKGKKQEEKEARQTRLQAETQRWSPWTGIQGTPAESGDDAVTAGMGGLVTGLGMGQSINSANRYNKALDAQTALNEARTAALTPGGAGGGGDFSGGAYPSLTGGMPKKMEPGLGVSYSSSQPAYSPWDEMSMRGKNRLPQRSY